MFRWMNPSSFPVDGLRLVMYLLRLLLTEVKYPPVSRCPWSLSNVSTVPLALCPKLVMTLPVDVLTAARLRTGLPPIELKSPPSHAVAQLRLSAMELTTPLTPGFHDETLYGALALKLN